jgi:uncharacterized membrane protein
MVKVYSTKFAYSFFGTVLSIAIASCSESVRSKYAQLGLKDPEQLAIAIIKTLFKQ